MRENLKNIRIQKSYTQAELAKILGITTRQYQKLEAGTSNGTIPLWEKMRELLGKTIDYLIAKRTPPR